MEKENMELCWISIILRLAMGMLFAVAGISKFLGGLDASAGQIIGMVKDTVLPAYLVIPYANVLPFAEILVGIWLLVGFRLRIAWIFTAFLLISLAFGMTVAKQSAADIFTFILISCAGLYVSRFDCSNKCGCSAKK